MTLEILTAMVRAIPCCDACAACNHPLEDHVNGRDCLWETGELVCMCDRAIIGESIISRALEGWGHGRNMRSKAGKRLAMLDVLERAVRECSSIADCLTGGTAVGQSILKAAGLGPTAPDTHPAAAGCPRNDIHDRGGCQLPPTS